MSYTFKPLTNFMGTSDRAPLTRNAYQSLTSVSKQGVPADSDSDEKAIASQSGRENIINKLGGSITSQRSLVSSLMPSAGSLGGGLYSAVGQLPAYKIASLIDKYV